MMIQAVIFDIDNTLYDFDALNRRGVDTLAAYAVKHLGLSEEVFREAHTDTMKEMLVSLKNTAACHNRQIRYQKILEKYQLPLQPHALSMYDAYWRTLIENMVPYEGVLDLMRALKGREIRIGIGTDMTAHIQFCKLQKLGVLPYIDFLVSSEEAGCEKPSEAFFEVCRAKAGCPAEDCMFIGDNLRKDVKGSMTAGMKGVWYLQGEKTDPEGVEDSIPRVRHFSQILEMIMPEEY